MLNRCEFVVFISMTKQARNFDCCVTQHVHLAKA